jgi:hypothetical protein
MAGCGGSSADNMTLASSVGAGVIFAIARMVNAPLDLPSASNVRLSTSDELA